MVNFHADKVVLAPATETYHRTPTDLYINWLQEVVYIFLMFSKNDVVRADDGFVALFARAMHQVVTSAKYKTGKNDNKFDRIPQEFQIFGKTFTFEYDKNILYHNQCVGMAEFHTERILLHPDDEVLERTEADEYQTFMHEVVHVILMSIMEVELNEDEAFVNMLAAALAQAFQTAEYK